MAELSSFGCNRGECQIIEKDDGAACSTCGRQLTIRDGLTFDSLAPILSNALEEISYDSMHGVSAAASQALGSGYVALLKSGAGLKLDRTKKVLEVGSGSGLLSLGLFLQGISRNLVVSDVSEQFLKTNLSNIREAAKTIDEQIVDMPTFVVCSIDDLPFKQNSFDFILGNSVLHHIYNYREALVAMHSRLRPGGAIVMSEPVVQGKALPSMILKLIAAADKRSSQPRLDRTELQRIDDLVTMSSKRWWEVQAEAAKDTADDKHLFDVEELKLLGRDIGFSNVHIIDTGDIATGLKASVEALASLVNIQKEKLGNYDDIMEAVQATLVSNMRDYFYCNHALLVFQR